MSSTQITELDPDDVLTLPTPKPAWATTEFWLTIVPVLLAVITALTGEDTSGIDIGSVAAIAAAIATAGYAVARAITKRAMTLAQVSVLQHYTALQWEREREAQAVAMEEKRLALQMQRAYERTERILEDDVDVLDQRLEKLIDALVPRKQNGDVDTRTRAGKKAVELGLVKA